MSQLCSSAHLIYVFVFFFLVKYYGVCNLVVDVSFVAGLAFLLLRCSVMLNICLM